jgi:[ribosomal protein S5]-alanine N-acetyltransferase
MTHTPATRLITLDDAPALTEILSENRDFLEPWEPLRDDRFFTLDAQRENIAGALERHEQGSGLSHVILDEAGHIVGRITLSGITRGPFQSCSVGFWVSERANGRGLATAALRHIVHISFEELRLHRLQAETLLHNHASQKILGRLGFLKYGMAPQYLKIAGQWQDFLMFQLLNQELCVVTAGPGSRRSC